MEEYLEIGEIINTHGVKGEIKVKPLTDDPKRFNKLKWIFVEKDNTLLRYDITSVKYFKQMVILKLKDIDDMSAAESLKGCILKVDRANAVKLPKDSFFICDLIGSTVYDGEGNNLGVLAEVIKTGSNDVFIVKDENNREILIPALKTVIKDISLEDKKITAVLPEGLVSDEV